MSDRLDPIPPGEILREEFLEPLGITPYRLAKDIAVPQTRIHDILNARRAITADTALRLGRYFSMTPAFWLNLQGRYELELARERQQEVEHIRPLARPTPKELTGAR